MKAMDVPMMSNDSIDYTGNQFEKCKVLNIPLDACDEIVELLDKQDLEWEEGEVGNVNGKTVDHKMRKCEVSWVTHTGLKKFLWKYFVAANNTYSDWNFDLDTVEDIQYTVYKEGADHYSWHTDSVQTTVKGKCRKLSMTLVLNDDWEGSDFELKKTPNTPEMKIPLRKGELLVFPSMMNHRVTPLSSGERKVLVAWAWGPLFK